MNDRVRLAIVGCGGIAKAHMRGYEEMRRRGIDNFTIAAVCDNVKERTEEFAEKAESFQGEKPRTYTNLDSMLKDGDLDAADICVPHGYHHMVAVPCLDAKLHVMVEKPLGITVKASKLIIEAGRKNNRYVAVAENLRRYPGQRTTWWIVNEAKLIGTPRFFFAQRACRQPISLEPEPMQWRGERLVGGGGLIFDSGAHYMDTIRYIFGDVERVYAEMRTFERRTFEHPTRGTVVGDVEDSWTATIVFKSGLTGVWTFFPCAKGKSFVHVIYYGDKGSFEDTSGDIFHGLRQDGELTLEDGTKRSFKDLQIEFLLSLGEGEKERLFPKGITEGIALECCDFVDAVAQGRRPDVDGMNGLKAKAIAIAIYESAWTGKAVSVDDVIDGKVEEYQRDINEKWGIS